MDLTPVWLTIQVATVTTVILILVATPLAYWLARTRFRWRGAIEALVALPLVLPPTVLGFYLLMLLGPRGPVGTLWQAFGGSGTLTFSFAGLVIASVLYSLPFAVQPLTQAFRAVPAKHLEAAATLGASPVDQFFSIVFPISARGYLVAATLAFAHTVGEFGVVLMVGGNIPGETQVVSIAIYDHVESLEYLSAHLLSAGLLAFSFLVLLVVYSLNWRATASQP